MVCDVKYSVVIPCYNVVKTIDKAIRSVVSDDTEIICVNDGSTDGTRRMLRRYANVRLIEMDRNRGPGPALNAGIEEARTNLIFVLGADNYLPPGLIQTLDEAREEAKVSIAAPSEIRYFKGNIGRGRRYNPRNKDGFCDIDMYINRKKNHGSSGHYLFTKLSWRLAGGYPSEPGVEGWVFGLRQLAANYKVLIVPNTFYYHGVRIGSLWNRWEKLGLNDKAMLKAIREYRESVEVLK